MRELFHRLLSVARLGALPGALPGALLGTLLAAPAESQSTRPALALERLEHMTAEAGDAHFGAGLLQRAFGPVDAARARLAEDTGIDIRGRYAPIYQFADGEDLLSSGLDLYARWDGVIDEDWGKGSLDVHFELRRDDVLGTDAFEFAADLGMRSLSISGEDAGSFASFDQISWEQLFLDGDVNVTLGQLDPTSLFDENAYAGNDRESFIAEPFSSDPVRPTWTPGLGAGIWYSPERWYVGAALIAADGNREAIDTDAVSDGNWSHLAEAALTPDLRDMGRGTYRLTFQNVEASDEGPDGLSWAASVDQEMGERHGVFARWSYGDGHRTRFDQMISTGIVIDEMFGAPHDRFGLGLFWGSPSESALREEWGFETYWRVQLTQRVDITPDLYFLKPSEKGEPLHAILGLRLGINL